MEQRDDAAAKAWWADKVSPGERGDLGSDKEMESLRKRLAGAIDKSEEGGEKNIERTQPLRRRTGGEERTPVTGLRNLA
ncbi:hypothetical protein NPIL_521611 [Nephila pilipes]|uniref:Uncharacterized protein n=1 Tax=Nephila pilipes TaxID=299642 RepID=A0A8X6U936_NEPPI|nr:hypothetical protein NPIL_521611 [Nephila pilipes]